MKLLKALLTGLLTTWKIHIELAKLWYTQSNATCNSLCLLVGWLVGHTFVFSMRTAFNAPAQLIIAPAQLTTAQPPATGVAVYTALFF